MIKIELFKTFYCCISGISHGVNKLQIVLKELRESLYWLRLIRKTNLFLGPVLEKIIQEAKELTNIIVPIKSGLQQRKVNNFAICILIFSFFIEVCEKNATMYNSVFTTLNVFDTSQTRRTLVAI